ncbi:MAG: LysM peptidoglycan-binding domain-containing protein [Sandaracinaceae bacterium]|nr:LysM peptidoglycan-binding domain-containing protein [Sandaracinaceae bacterium]
MPAAAEAQREHTVRPGQSLARIASRYEVSVDNLAAANQLRRNAQLRPGQTLRIPERGVHYVGRGETLAAIARQHECSVAALRSANRLRSDSLRLGQRLLLPGFDSVPERQEAARQWGRPRSPGVASLYRRTIDRRLRVRLVDSRGRARTTARRRLQELMRANPRDHARLGPLPPPRLIEMLARVSDHFGGREITIVSGYRGAGRYTRASSQHTSGNALDIRIRGVPHTELRDYLRETFQNVGVGFYPRSHFVHIDVRSRSSYWVDWSGPGEAPEYQRAGEAPPADATPAETARTQMPGPADEDEGELAPEDE